MTENRGRLWLGGRLLLTTTHQPVGAPLVDGGTSWTAEGDHYGSLIIRRPRRGRAAWVIGWRGARSPSPGRWLPRAIWFWRGPRGPVVHGGESTAGPPALTFDEMGELGLVQEINRQLLHPVGLALARHQDGTLTVLTDPDPEGWRFEGLDLSGAARAFALRQADWHPRRRVALGYVVQPLNDPRIECVVKVGHPAGTLAAWRCELTGLIVCNRHRDQYAERPDLGPYSWVPVDG